MATKYNFIVRRNFTVAPQDQVKPDISIWDMLDQAWDGLACAIAEAERDLEKA